MRSALSRTSLRRLYTRLTAMLMILLAAACLSFGSVASASDVTWWSLALQSVDVWSRPGAAILGGGGGGRLTQPMCSQLEGLSAGQQRICQLYPDHMASVAHGVQLGVGECQFQLRDRRWNCSTTNDTSVFGPLLAYGSREAAFVHAISAAGVTYAVSRACRDAQLSTCGCSRRPRPAVITAVTSRVTSSPTPGGADWMWGGCGDNTQYGYKFAQGFVDVREREKNYPRHSDGLARMLMNIHNNEAGRLAVFKYARPACKCHGVSGSCNMRTCWHQLPSFRDVGDRLRAKYDAATEAAFNRPGTRLVRASTTVSSAAAAQSAGARRRRRRRQNGVSRPSKDELLYVHPSPDYCEADELSGSAGTHGRQCTRSRTGGPQTPDSCELLCCGRGYNAFRTTVIERCRCRFHWCCEVRCSVCERAVDVHVCK